MSWIAPLLTPAGPVTPLAVAAATSVVAATRVVPRRVPPEKGSAGATGAAMMTAVPRERTSNDAGAA